MIDIVAWLKIAGSMILVAVSWTVSCMIVWDMVNKEVEEDEDEY